MVNSKFSSDDRESKKITTFKSNSTLKLARVVPLCYISWEAVVSGSAFADTINNPVINQNIIIDKTVVTSGIIDGSQNSSYTLANGSVLQIQNKTGLFVNSGQATLSNLTLEHFATTGGNGSGGGAGLGGALFINSGASAILNNVSFTNNTASGGAADPTATVGGSLNNIFNNAANTGVAGSYGAAGNPHIPGSSGSNGGNGGNAGNSTTYASTNGAGGNGGAGGSGAPSALGIPAGNGGAGGNGGNGGFGYGGGAGGFGGAGGLINSLGAVGGTGGAGGVGGNAGFGAGGGAGGIGGIGGFPISGTGISGVSGAGGAGGTAGFGGGNGAIGAGSNLSSGLAGGGSGYGGAIFVNNAASLTVTGNAVFSQDNVVGGAGANGGATGHAVGSDLFMMTGANVTLSPDANGVNATTPNKIVFNGTIADDSAASIGAGNSFAKAGNGLTVNHGLVIFNGANTYSGQTVIGTAGVLQAQDGTGISSTSNINLNGGVLQMDGTFNRALGSSGDTVQWSGSGGFAAATNKNLNVNLNNGSQLVWANTPYFVKNGNALTFGSASAGGTVNFENALNLNGGTRSILVTSSSTTNPGLDSVTLSGVISDSPQIVPTFAAAAATSGGLVINDSTHNGTVIMSANNTYVGTTEVAGGTLDLSGQLASALVQVDRGATLIDEKGGLASTAQLNNAGTVNLNANNTIASFTSSGSLNGTGNTLTAATYALNGGSQIYANLGKGSLTSNGSVEIDGTTNADFITVASESTLNMGNPLTASNSTVSHLVNSAVSLTDNGVLNLNDGNETLGSLYGSGVLNVKGKVLQENNGGSFTGTINGQNTDFIAKGGKLILNNSKDTFKTVSLDSGSSIAATGTTLVSAPTITVNNSATLSLVSSDNIKYTTLTGGTASNPGGTIDTQNFINPAGSTVAGFLSFTGNFENNGLLSPGNSPGITTIAGNFTQNAQLLSQFASSTPGTGYDQVRVGGTVTLNPSSTLIAQGYGGIVPQFGNEYQMISDLNGNAKRDTGSWGKVEFQLNAQTAPVVNAAAVFDDNTGKLITTGLNAANSTFAQLGHNSNQQAAVNAIFNAAQAQAGQNQIDSATGIGQSALALLTDPTAINRVVPDNYNNLTDYALLTNKAVANILFDRPLSFDSNDSGLAKGSNNESFAQNKSIYTGYTRNRYSVSSNSTSRNDFYVGTEIGNNKIAVGALFMGSVGGVTSLYGGGNTSGYGGTAYVRVGLAPKLKLLGNIGYSGYNYSIHRQAVVGTAAASTTGDGINSALGLNYQAYENNGYAVQTRLGVGYGRAHINGFQESGSAQSMNVSGYNASRFSGQVGVILSKDFKVLDRPLKLALDFGGDRAFTDQKNSISAAVVGDPKYSFPITAASNTQIIGTAGISVNYKLTDKATIYTKYEASTLNHGIYDNGTVEVNYAF